MTDKLYHTGNGWQTFSSVTLQDLTKGEVSQISSLKDRP